jgi:hypothetical protein
MTMVSITPKTRENISLAVSSACLLISALWIYYHATLTGDTNLSELTGFHLIMWGSSLPFGGMFLGPYIAPAVAALAGFFSTSNYWHTDRPTLRAVSRVTLIAHGILTAALAVFITLALTR